MQHNSQPIEKSVATLDGTTLDVHSIFYTIQGEGPYAGKPAIFIRLAGCNLQCPGCDTDYTNGRKKMSLQEIFQAAGECTVRAFSEVVKPLIVITGGEPFRQNVKPLVNDLISMGYTVQIETNGTLPPPKGLHLHAKIVVSPKTGKVNTQTEQRAIAFKYVANGVHNAEDGLPVNALYHSAHPQLARPTINNTAKIYLQPMDEQDDHKNHINCERVVNECLKHGYNLCLQVHKIVGVE